MVENKKLFSPEAFDKPEHTSTSKKRFYYFFLIGLVLVLVLGMGYYYKQPQHGNGQQTIVSDSLTKDSVQKDSTLADSLKKENSSVVSDEESNNKETEDIKDEMQSKASVPVDTNVKSQQESNSESSSMGSVEAKAKQVIRGIYGNGSVRKQKLGNDYAEIQGKVNEMYRNGLVH